MSLIVYNAHGDVTGLTNASGTVTKSYVYDAFGNEKNPADADANPFRYCGEYFDKETGSIYLRARYYVPGLGRFTTQDPIRDGLNWYTYCGNNPIRFVDPTGLFYMPDHYDQKKKNNPGLPPPRVGESANLPPPKPTHSSSSTFYFKKSGIKFSPALPDYTSSTTFYFNDSKTGPAWPTNNHSLRNDYPDYETGDVHNGRDLVGGGPIVSVTSGFVVSITNQYSNDYRLKYDLRRDVYDFMAGSIEDQKLRIQPYGNNIIILAPDGSTIKYSHLQLQSSSIVEVGDYVKSGQLLGYMGSTGNATGTHLHIGVRTSKGAWVDPVTYFPKSN